MSLQKILFLLSLQTTVLISSEQSSSYRISLHDIPAEVQLKIWAPFYEMQSQKIYTNKIKQEEVAQTVELALQRCGHRFLAAVEIRRFFHKPERIEKLATNNALLIDILYPNPNEYQKEVRANMLAHLVTCSTAYKPRNALNILGAICALPIQYTEETIRIDYCGDYQSDDAFCKRFKPPLEFMSKECATFIAPANHCTILKYNNDKNHYPLSPDIINDHYAIGGNIGCSAQSDQTWYGIWDQCSDIIITAVPIQGGTDITTYSLKPYRAKTGMQRLMLSSIIGYYNTDYRNNQTEKRYHKDQLIQNIGVYWDDSTDQNILKRHINSIFTDGTKKNKNEIVPTIIKYVVKAGKCLVNKIREVKEPQLKLEHVSHTNADPEQTFAPTSRSAILSANEKAKFSRNSLNPPKEAS